MAKNTDLLLRQLAAAAEQLKTREMLEAFDPTRPGSKPTKAQQEIIDAVLNRKARYITVRAGNQSGKSSTGAKAFATMFREDGITWQRPTEWSDSLQFYILGRTSKQVEESLHRRIMSHVLEPDAIREVRQGGALQKVIHKHNGNTILYFSHHNTNQAQQAVQSFTGHGAWCDELPTVSVSLRSSPSV